MKKLFVILLVLCLAILPAALAEAAQEAAPVEPAEGSEALPLPIGDYNPASDFMFTGKSYILPLVERDEVWNAPSMMNVSFEPCSRTDWHSHAGGQILIAVGGVGIHQVEGQEPELLLPGTVARVEPGVMHWHGAADEGWFCHIAIETNPDTPGFEMGDKITDEIYEAALAQARALHEEEQ